MEARAWSGAAAGPPRVAPAAAPRAPRAPRKAGRGGRAAAAAAARRRRATPRAAATAAGAGDAGDAEPFPRAAGARGQWAGGLWRAGSGGEEAGARGEERNENALAGGDGDAEMRDITPPAPALDAEQLEAIERAAMEVAARGVVQLHALGRRGAGERQDGARVALSMGVVGAAGEDLWEALNDHEETSSAAQRGVSRAEIEFTQGGTALLRQASLCQGVYWQLGGRTSVRLEQRSAVGGRELRFEGEEGEFERFRGRWVVEEEDAGDGGGGDAKGPPRARSAVLRYEAEVVPIEADALPPRALERRLREDAEEALRAVAARGAAIAIRRKIVRASGRGDAPTPLLAARDLSDFDAPATWGSATVSGLGPGRAARTAAAALQDALDVASGMADAEPDSPPAPRAEDNVNRGMFGVASVPLPVSQVPAEQQGAQQRAQAEQQQQQQQQQAELNAGVQEVHLRNMDGSKWKRRRALAVAVVDAPPAAVWDVLTDYGAYADFMPGVTKCEARELPSTGPFVPPQAGRRLQLTQVGYKFSPYAALRAKAVLDLIEMEKEPPSASGNGSASSDAPTRQDRHELLFKLVEGDFERMQGRWIVEGIPDAQVSAAGAGDDGGGGGAPAQPPSQPSRSRLVYMAEISVKRRLGRFKKFAVMEPLIERVVYEDIPLVLEAIRERVSTQQVLAAASEAGAVDAALAAAGPDAALADDILAGTIAAFVAEHCAALGEGVMPRQADVIAAGRSDLARAIDAAGGFAEVAKRLQLRPVGKQTKPRGYWQNTENVRAEVSAVIAENGWDPQQMPTRAALKAAGRMDIVRATEAYGGMREVALLLGLSPSRRTRARAKKTGKARARRRSQPQRPSYGAA